MANEYNRENMITAIEDHAKGHIAKHKMNVEVYLKNAALLNLFLRKYGFTFVILTNNKAYIEKKIKKEIKDFIPIEEILFNTHVPRNMHFFSCHYRVDVFRYFSTLKNTFSILLDLDVVIIKNLKKINFSKFSNSGIFSSRLSSNLFLSASWSKRSCSFNPFRDVLSS